MKKMLNLFVYNWNSLSKKLRIYIIILLRLYVEGLGW